MTIYWVPNTVWGRCVDGWLYQRRVTKLRPGWWTAVRQAGGCGEEAEGQNLAHSVKGKLHSRLGALQDRWETWRNDTRKEQRADRKRSSNLCEEISQTWLEGFQAGRKHCQPWSLCLRYQKWQRQDSNLDSQLGSYCGHSNHRIMIEPGA